jgi:membrane associated rhomboid family serine protease
MGLYDRDYYQEDDDSASSFLGPRRSGSRMMVTNIVIVTTVFWIADHLGTTGWLSDLLALRGDLFQNPLHAYQLVTYGLTHALLGQPFGIWHILFNMFALWMFGREMEWKYGPKELLRFYVLAVIFSGLAWVGIQTLTGHENARLIGASGGVAAVLFLFILNYPQRTLYLYGILGVPAWLLGAVYVVGSIVVFFGSGADRVAHEAHLAGAAFGSAYYLFGWNFGRLSSFSPVGWRGLIGRLKPKPKLKVHDPERQPYARRAQKARRLQPPHAAEASVAFTFSRQAIRDVAPGAIIANLR